MGSSSSNSTSSRSSISFHLLKSLVRGLAVVGLMWILLAGTTPEGTTGTTTTRTTTTTTSTTPHTKSNLAPTESAGKIKGNDHVVVVGKEKLAHPKLDLINYMSKRRVPNGPDPIHNRRAGKSGRPPGQA
ncbi:uncharacterized protein LOC115714513 [Cannabis sativa]|uniref:uncharacterized protein LOC115714513 n=1 Tax=Cannabis sativa TaxID=3483 RepID=UPI0029CA2C75|nr:uncharacterized protein LOC115714513 [Cannabis sativa]